MKTPEKKLEKRNLPTLEDVAERAGVSTATVSRCLNEPHKVSQKTREKVMASVRALHYAPNFGARAIAANRTGTFGAVIPTMENAIFARGIEAFQQVLVQHNATMLVASSGYDTRREAELVRTLVARGADGLLLIGAERDPEIHAFLKSRNIPFVVAWAVAKDPEISFAGFDNREASAAMVRKAIELGHRNLGFISAISRGNDRAMERIAGARKAMHDMGLDEADLRVFEVPYDIEAGGEAFRKLVRPDHRPDIVFCGNDVLAVGAIQAAREMGLKVPADISITGFDDIEIARIIDPPLTTVHVPHAEMGRIAAESLLKLVRGEGPFRTCLETRIMERASLGLPKTD